MNIYQILETDYILFIMYVPITSVTNVHYFEPHQSLHQKVDIYSEKWIGETSKIICNNLLKYATILNDNVSIINYAGGSTWPMIMIYAHEYYLSMCMIIYQILCCEKHFMLFSIHIPTYISSEHS